MHLAQRVGKEWVEALWVFAHGEMSKLIHDSKCCTRDCLGRAPGILRRTCQVVGTYKVDMLSNPTEGSESESTVLGPFYRENPPVLPKGASIISNASSISVSDLPYARVQATGSLVVTAPPNNCDTGTSRCLPSP